MRIRVRPSASVETFGGAARANALLARLACVTLALLFALAPVGAFATAAGPGTKGDGWGAIMKNTQTKGRLRIEGSWELEINTTQGAGVPPHLKALITFDAGGGCVETILLPPVVPAHGAWVRTGNRTFDFAVVHHLLDPAGNFVGTVRATSHVTLDGPDEFTAEFEGGFYDPAGNLLFPVSGTERATRIKAA